MTAEMGTEYIDDPRAVSVGRRRLPREDPDGSVKEEWVMVVAVVLVENEDPEGGARVCGGGMGIESLVGVADDSCLYSVE